MGLKMAWAWASIFKESTTLESWAMIKYINS